MRKTNAGVTLMELLIVIVIIGILMAIAVPAYRNYVIRANRADAKAALLGAAGVLERCYTRFNSYTAAAGCTATFPISTGTNYDITDTDRTDTAFTLTATPKGGQDKDAECKNFTLSSTNVKGVSGSKSGTPEFCWGR